MAIADELADRLLTRDVDLARLEASEQRRVLRQLRQLRRDLKARLAAIDPTGPRRQAFQRRRLERLLSEANTAIRSTIRTIRRQHGTLLSELATLEATTLADELNSTAGVDLFTGGLDPARLQAIMDDVAVEGVPLSEWWSRQDQAIRRRFLDEMRRGLLAGDQLSELLRRVDDLMGIGERQAEALVRTGMQSAQNHARQLLFEANDDIADALEWVVTLDNRLCPRCAALAGLRWTVRTKEPIGHNKGWPGPILHPQCRCTQVVVVKPLDALLEL